MTPHAQLLIVGAGDHGRVVLDLARTLRLIVTGFVELGTEGRALGTRVDGVGVIGNLSEPELWLPSFAGCSFVAAVGNNERRRLAYDAAIAMELQPLALVHPTATVLGGARISQGAQVCAGAVVGVGATIGANAIINTAATVDHDADVSAHSFVAPGAHLAGRVRIGEGAFIGIGAVIREGCTIGAGAVVGAGAAVIGDVAPGVQVVGVPARALLSR